MAKGVCMFMWVEEPTYLITQAYGRELIWLTHYYFETCLICNRY